MTNILEYCKDRYKFLFTKKIKQVVNGKRIFKTVELSPYVEEHSTHYRVYAERDASPLILSKNV